MPEGPAFLMQANTGFLSNFDIFTNVLAHLRAPLMTPGHNDFLLNFVSATDSHSVFLVSMSNIVFIQSLEFETLKSFLSPPSEILTAFGLNYCQFCFRNGTQI